MRFGVYILVVMLFLGFTVGEAAAYLTIYNTSVVSRRPDRINISVFWSGEDDPDQLILIPLKNQTVQLFHQVSGRRE